MADEQRRLLEQLMGKELLISPQTTRRREVDIRSSQVCKAFLVGQCPHDLFSNTKMKLGSCPNLHLQKHKLEYEYRIRKGEEFPEFQHEYHRTLQKYLLEIDSIIANSAKKLQHTPEEKEKIATVTRQLESLDTKIGLMTLEITHLGKNNQVLKALQETINLENLLKERDVLVEQARKLAEHVGQSSAQKLQVCEICGAFLSRLDSDRRLADHFIGKIHLGYEFMRNEFKRLDQERIPMAPIE